MTGDMADSTLPTQTIPPMGEVESMHRLIADIDPVIRPLIPMFLEQSLLRINSLDDACAEGDFIAIKKIAHTMKGSASSYGFTAMASVSRDIEDVLRSEPVDRAALETKIKSLREMHDSALSVVQNNPALFEEE